MSIPGLTSNSSLRRVRAVSGAAALFVLALVGFILWSGLVAPTQFRLPVPSLDGMYFAYFSRRAQREDGRTHDLIISSLEGRVVARFAVAPGALEWSNAGHLALMDPARTRVTLVGAVPRGLLIVTELPLAPGAEPQWSPDGNKLAYRRGTPRGEEFFIYDLQQTLARPVPPDPEFPLDEPRLLSWSPSGRHVYFLNREDKQTVLARTDVESGETRVVSRSVEGGRSSGLSVPQIAPDGMKILLRSDSNVVVDAESGETLWELPDDSRPLWSPWSVDGRLLYYWRRDEAARVYAHEIETEIDEAVLDRVSPDGFFARDGKSYFFRRIEGSTVLGSTPGGTLIRRPGWEWEVAESGSESRQKLEGLDLWPWQQTVEGHILARRVDGTRVEMGLFRPDEMEFTRFEFPTTRAEIRENLDRYSRRLFFVTFYLFLALVALATRASSASTRAFAALNFLVATWLAAWTAGDSAGALEPPTPYRTSIWGEASGSWLFGDSFAMMVPWWAETAKTWLAALAPPIGLRFFTAFPDGSRVWSGRRAPLAALYAAALAPLASLVVSPPLGGRPPTLPMLTMALAGAAVGAGALVGLLESYRHPPDRRAREQVCWVSAALGFIAAGLPLAMLERSLSSGPSSAFGILLGSVSTVARVVLLLVIPVVVLYTLAARKPYDLRLFVRRGFRVLIVAGPGLMIFFLALTSIDFLLSGPSHAASSSVWFLSAVLTAALYIPLFRPLRRAAERLVVQEAEEFRGELESLAQELPHLLDHPTLVGRLRGTLRRTLRIQHCYLFVLERQAKRLRLKDGTGELESSARAVEFHPAEPLCRFLAQEDTFLEVEVSPYDRRLIPILESAADRLGTLQAEVVFGLRRRHELLGLLVVGPKKSGEFYDAAELALLEQIAAQVAVAHENIETFEELARDRELRRELEDASEMQAQLLPSIVPRLRTAQLAGRCVPARMVSGDYYDFLKLPGGRLGLALGDIAGRGMPASLQMATLQSLVRTQASTAEDLGEFARQVNAQLYATSEGRRACALFYGVYDDVKMRFEYVNAGHLPPILVQGSLVRTLEPTGLILGLLNDVRHVSCFERLEPGAVLVLYSDGIPNAVNGRGETFGLIRFVESVIRARDLEATRIIDRVFGDVREFMSGIPTDDDQTLVVLKVQPA